MIFFWTKIKSSNWLGKDQLWLPISIAFLIISFSKIHDGGTNANARFATLRAMSDDYTFKIDNYYDWTIDWAKTPEGHYYSNKAPGPTLAAFPIFWLVDHALFSFQNKYKDEKGRRQQPRGPHKVIISGLLQVLPFLLISLLLMQELNANSSAQSRLIAYLGILFANTAAALMSSYMGNPFTAVTILCFAYFYKRGDIAAATFFFAFTILSEYTTGAFLFPFIWLMFKEAKTSGFTPTFKKIILGGVFPFILWCWYHLASFGGILSLPYKFEMITVIAPVEKNTTSLWGFISFLPNPEYLFQLLFGSSRGILFTQPWIFLCIVFSFIFYKTIKDERAKNLLVFTLASFFILLSINAGFPGWHGGGNPGPRYLAAILPLVGFYVPVFYEKLSANWKRIFLFSIFVGIALRGLAYATWILAPNEPIWPYYLHAVNNPITYFYLILYFTVLAGAIYLTRKKIQTGAI